MTKKQSSKPTQQPSKQVQPVQVEVE